MGTKDLKRKKMNEKVSAIEILIPILSIKLLFRKQVHNSITKYRKVNKAKKGENYYTGTYSIHSNHVILEIGHVQLNQQ